MSLESIKRVAEIEAQAAAKRTEAEAEGRKLLAEAEQVGKEKLETARRNAEAEMKRLMNEAIIEAETHAKKRAEKSMDDCNALKEKAQQNLSKAAAVIVERIVNA